MLWQLISQADIRISDDTFYTKDLFVNLYIDRMVDKLCPTRIKVLS